MLQKLTPITRENKHLLGPQHKTVASAKLEQKQKLDRDFKLFERLMSDSAIRRSVEQRSGLPRDPMSVWEKSSESSLLTVVAYDDLPAWDDLTETMKVLVAFDLGMECGTGHSFTCHIDHDIISRMESSTGWFAMVKQRIDRRLTEQGIRKLPMFYTVETKTRAGANTRPHLHGFALCDDRLDATRLKVAFEKALNPSLKRVGKRQAIKMEDSYDHEARGEFLGRGAWGWYMTKRAITGDRRFPGRRVHFSQSLTDLARDAWSLRREALQ